LDVVARVGPRSILDIGLGVGTYGFLCAVMLDQHRLLPSGVRSADVRIDGIERFCDYVGSLQETVYARSSEVTSSADVSARRWWPVHRSGFRTFIPESGNLVAIASSDRDWLRYYGTDSSSSAYAR